MNGIFPRRIVDTAWLCVDVLLFSLTVSFWEKFTVSSFECLAVVVQLVNVILQSYRLRDYKKVISLRYLALMLLLANSAADKDILMLVTALNIGLSRQPSLKANLTIAVSCLFAGKLLNRFELHIASMRYFIVSIIDSKEEALAEKVKLLEEQSNGVDDAIKHVNSLPIGIIHVEDYKITFINKEASSIVDGKLDKFVRIVEFKAKPTSDERSISFVKSTLAKVFKEVTDVPKKIGRITRANGTKCFLTVSARRITPSKIEMFFIDTTEIRLEAKEKAESKLKSLFLAKIAHEIKNPILSVSSMSKLVLDLFKRSSHSLEALREADMTDKLNFIYTVCSHVVELINDLTTFSHMGQDKKLVKLASLNIKIKRVDIRKLVKFTVEFIKKRIKFENRSEDLLVSSVISEEVPRFIETDKTKLRQVLLNLLSNAMKHCTKGKIVLSVSALNSTQLNSKVKFEVKDSGRGISRAKLAELDSACNPNIPIYTVEGSGLGLRIVRECLSLINTALCIESEEGVGSTFSFTLSNIKNSFDSLEKESDLSEVEDDKTELCNCAFDIRDAFKSDEETECIKMLPITTKSSKKHNLSITDVRFGKRNSVFSFEPQRLVKTAIFNIPVVVICDDETFIRDKHSRLVNSIAKKEQINVEVKTARNGVECLNLVLELKENRHKIAMLLTDQSMPFMNGGKAIEILSAMMERGEIEKFPIYAVTAFFDLNNADYLISSGATRVFNKPLKVNTVKQIFQAIDN